MKVAYTLRVCHLKDAPKHRVGDIINRGDVIGTMGSSGQSDANHAHVDTVKGEQSGKYSLADIEAGNPEASPRQMNWFIDDELFGIELYITTAYADPLYQRLRKKVHLGYDVVPVDRHKTTAHHKIRWNRTVPGRVTAVRFDPEGYGHYIMITFEVEEED